MFILFSFSRIMLLTKYSQVVLFCLRQRSMRFILLCCVPKLYYTYSGFSELEINNDKLLSPFCVRHEPQINEIPSYHKEYLTSNNKIWRPHQKTLHNHNESDFDSSDSYYGAGRSKLIDNRITTHKTRKFVRLGSGDMFVSFVFFYQLCNAKVTNQNLNFIFIFFC